MLSQPWTKIFLKTSEPRAAKWVSDAIGEQDREWLRESRTSGMHWGQQGRDSRTYLVEKKTIPLVLPSEISGLPELHGYLKNGNDVVEMSFPYLDWPNGNRCARPGRCACRKNQGAAKRRSSNGSRSGDRPAASLNNESAWSRSQNR